MKPSSLPGISAQIGRWRGVGHSHDLHLREGVLILGLGLGQDPLGLRSVDPQGPPVWRRVCTSQMGG
jgi:hypothetical protein